MDNLSNTSVIQKTFSIPGDTPQVQLYQNAFDTIIWQKGYDVYVDQVINCPCRNIPDSQGSSACLNCGGSGYVFFNRRETKMVLQSINLDTKFKEWSEERLGTCKVSMLNDEHISFMDRIVLKHGHFVHNETLFFKQNSENKWLCKTTYDIIEALTIFLFQGTDQPLKRLIISIDYVITQNNWIELLTPAIGQEEYPTVAIRYTHRPTYHVVDMTRGIMDSPGLQSGKEVDQHLPVSCVARLAHYVLDQKGYGDGSVQLFDNSYSQSCSTQYKPQCSD